MGTTRGDESVHHMVHGVVQLSAALLIMPAATLSTYRRAIMNRFNYCRSTCSLAMALLPCLHEHHTCTSLESATASPPRAAHAVLLMQGRNDLEPAANSTYGAPSGTARHAVLVMLISILMSCLRPAAARLACTHKRTNNLAPRLSLCLFPALGWLAQQRILIW